MKKKSVRTLCLLLCTALLFSSLPPIRAEAAEANAPRSPSSEVSVPEEPMEPVQEETEAAPPQAPSEEVTAGAAEPAAEETTEHNEAAAVPTEETAVPTEEAADPTEETTVPTEETTEPAEETTAPAEETAPTEETEPESETITAETSAEMGMFAAQSDTTGIEMISVGEEKSYELGNGDISLSFTPSEGGTYAFITRTGTVFGSCRLSVHEGDTCLAQSEWSTDERYNQWCCFNAEAGKEYILRFSWNAFFADVCVAKAETPTGIQISDEFRSGSVGDQFHLSAQFLPEGAVPENLNWSSSNPSVAYVDQNGNVTILANGSTNITVQSTSGFSASCSVYAQSPTSFSFDCHEMTRYLDAYSQRLDIGYSFEPYGTSEEIIQWDISDRSVADVTKYTSSPDHSFWELECYKTGETTITATTQSGLTDTCVLTVKNKEPIELDVPKTVTVHAGDTVRFSFNPVPESSTSYAFYSEDGNGLLSIGGYGYDSGKYVQSSEASCSELAVWNDTDKDQTYTVCIRKAVPAESINIIQEDSGEIVNELTGTVGDELRLTCEPCPKWSFSESWTWSISDESIVSIDEFFGIIILKKCGSAVITATSESGAQASCTVTVKEMETIQSGESRTITIAPQGKVRYSFTPETTGKYVFHVPYESFSLSIYKDGKFVGESVSNVFGHGLYCTMEKGVEYTLIAWYPDDENFGNITGTVYLDVLQEASSFSISRSYGAICLGQSFSIRVKNVLPESAYVVDTTWTVSDPSIVSISYESDDYAEFLFVGEGTATITATAGNGVSASYKVKVSSIEDWGDLGSKTVPLEGGETKCFRFVPQTSGKYVFTTPYIDTDDWQSGVDVIKEGDYIGEYISNYDSTGIYIEMEKGTEYLLTVTNYSDNTAVGTVSLGTYIEPTSLSLQMHEATDNAYYPSDILHVGGDLYVDVDVSPETTYAVGITLTSSDPSVFEIEKNEYGYYNFSAKAEGTVTITATAPNGLVGTKEVTVKEGGVLPILDGADSTVAVSSPLAVRIDGEIEKLDEVWVDGEKVEPNDYTVTKGSTVVTLRPEYMETLETGYHWLNVYFSDGWAATSFEITSSILGDSNGDGTVDVDDVFYLAMHITNQNVFPLSISSGDVNSDGKLDVDDVFYLAMHISAPDVFPLYPVNNP